MQEVSTVHEPLYPRAQVVGYWDSNNGCMVARAARAPWQLRGEVLDAKEPRVSGGWGWFRSSGLSGKGGLLWPAAGGPFSHRELS